MRISFLIITCLLTTVKTFSQPFSSDDYIQNFYVTCKANKYSAFLALQKGTELLETSQYSRSIKSYHKALEIDSLCCDALYMLGYCYQKQGDYKSAIDYCEKSIALSANNPSAWTIKANTFLLQKDTAKALTSFESAKKVAPDKIDGYYGIALIYYNQKKFVEVVALANEFEKLKDKATTRRDLNKLEKLKSHQ